MKNFLVVDGNSILNRAFYGIRPLTNQNGLNTNAVYGMVTILKKHIDALKPDYLVCAFDVHAKTFRHKACDFYKAKRKPMPPELFEQMPYAKEVLSSLGFHVIEKEGFEADDILGTCSKMSTKDVHVYLLTGDRDSLQLISDTTTVILVKTKEDIYYTPEKFVEDYGVTPAQFIDVKAVMGDSSDNIPGIAGIGEKGAFKLISDFGSLADLYEQFENASLSDSLKEKLRVGREMAFTSQFLATIVCDAPIEKTLDDLAVKPIDEKRLYELFKELEFERFITTFHLSPSIPKEQESSTYVEATEIQSVKDLKKGTYSVYFDNDFLQIFGENVCVKIQKERIGSFLTDNDCVCHDMKTLQKSFSVHCVFDVMLGGYVASSGDTDYSLGALSQKYLSRDFNPSYGAQMIAEIKEKEEEILKEQSSLSVLTDIEMPLAYLLNDMENEGFLVDIEGLKRYSVQLQEIAEQRQAEIYELAGEEFNINSPKQLGFILFEKLGLSHGKKTKSGYSTNAEILEDLANEHEIIRKILEYRQVKKLNSTYCEGLVKVADEKGRVHSSFNQTVTVTGRLSSSEPNLQNIPVRTELGRNFRKYFIAKNENYVLLDADYSQIELKVLAHLSKDANMIHAFQTGLDIHTATASQVFHVPFEAVTPEMRKSAKAVNFGIVYGIGEFSLAKDLHISRKEAKDYITSYFATYPDVKAYINSLVERAKETGYAETMFSRKRYIPELKANNFVLRSFGERVAMNSPIQGSAADIIKIAMIRVESALKKAKLDAKLILQVHDELIIESSKTDAERAKEILKNEMEKAVVLSVPLTADAGEGKTWFEAK